MDKDSAVKIICETFQHPFSKDSFAYFIKSLFNHIETASFIYRGNFIPDAYEPYIKSFERIGKYQDQDDNKIDLLIVYLKKGTSLEHARTMQRNFIAWYLNGSRGGILKDAALVAFVSPNSDDWRFSLVKMDYKIKQGKVKQELTPARRFSFLVGKNESSHTAQSRLVPILQDDVNDPTLKDLEDTFNVESVTKEFFKKYRDLFLEVEDGLDKIIAKDDKIKKDFSEKNIASANFVKKLLGQIVFLYFLQKKGWFGVARDSNWGTGPKDFLRQLFNENYGKYKNFFNDILEPLFYEALAIERPGDFYSRFNCKIPFLNGGLFDPMENYDWIHTDILLSNKLFSNNNKTKEGDIGDGILDIFDRYNFTVKEDEPLEKEVAIDPEMLGKVFENLLEVKDRKSKGTYYTPREIVHYMCQESLINYLYSELNPNYGQIGEIEQGKLLKTKEPKQKKISLSKPKEEVLKKDIETLIKCGEMTVEHEAIYIEKMSKDARYKGKYSEAKLPKTIEKNAKLIDEKLTNIRVCDPAVGSAAFPVGMMNEIVKARRVLTNYLKNKKQRTTYNFKRHAIQNCLYGVDIDPGAIEIAKLRLWLSLIVDEQDIKKIRPLPNLDYKIVCGNSLLGIEKNLFNQKLFAELETLKPLYFSETNTKKKQEYKKQIDDLIFKITDGNKNFDFKIYFSEVFRKKDGFDVVIANPPYIDSEAMSKKGQRDLRDFISKTYTMTKGNWDIYIAFFERGFKILNQQGVLTFITPDKWIAKPFGYEFRKSAMDKICAVLKAGRKVFEEAKIDAVVSFFIKGGCPSLKVFNFEDNQIVFKDELDKKIFHGLFAFDFVFSNHLSLLKKLEANPGKVVESFDCENACATSDAYKLKPLIKNLSKDGFDQKKQLKVINTGTIGKYISKWGKTEMTYLKNKYLYPVVDRQNFFKVFDNTYSKKSLQSKIIIKGLTLLDACLDVNGDTIPGKSTLVITHNDTNQLKFLLAIVNSKLTFFYIKEKYPASSYNEGINFTKVMINNLPIPKIKKQQKKSLINLVDKILGITKPKDYFENKEKQKKVAEYERQIDKMVYGLYGLTKREIKIMEDSGLKNMK